MEGKLNQLYAQGMRSFEQYDETHKYFTEGKQKDNNARLDFRTIDENALQGKGRRIGITLQTEKKAESAGSLNAYIYLIMDAQLNTQNGAYVFVCCIRQKNADDERTSYHIVRSSNWSRENVFSLEFV